jgi:hypothetical protein
MFGRRKRALTRAEKLRLKAAYAAGRVAPRMSKAAVAAQRAAGAAAETVAPQLEKAKEYAGPRLAALQQTAAVAVAPKIDKARRRSSAALDVLRGAEPMVVVEKKRRRWPLALVGLGLGVAAGAVARGGRDRQSLVEPVRPVPTLVPDERDVVILDDVRTTSETTTTMPDRVDGS